MKHNWRISVAAAVGVALLGGPAMAEDSQKLTFTGINYTKFLWSTARDQGGLYSFTTIPSEAFGNNGQGTELELLLAGKPSKYVEVSGRIQSRFNQNFWTNFGGFGGRSSFIDPDNPCVAGDCGEFDSRSAQYVKFRGMNVTITPGYKFLDRVSIGSSDWGMFDPFTIGKIRYIDRDNGSGLLFQGSAGNRKFTYDFARISLPRLWAGPNFSTGTFHAQDAAYGLQFGIAPSSKFDITLVGQYVNDIEVDSFDRDLDDGRDIRTRFRNNVVGARFGIHPSSKIDIRGLYYKSSADSDPTLNTPGSFGLAGFSPVPAGELSDDVIRLNVDVNDPFGMGLSFQIEAFDIGAEYVSMMAARRESDVLLTEGHDSTWAFPGPSNAAFGVFGGNPTRIGYGGWQGNAQQVATINVDNEFTDFEEPMAETVIGWKGVTVVPTLTAGNLELAGELSFIDYNTNWQAYDNPSRALDNTPYPTHELDTGVGHNFRSAYAPFQEKETTIAVLKARYLVDVGRGLDLFGKIKFLDETDERMNEARFLPYQPGDCPGGGRACANRTNFYSGTNSSASIYGNPPVITVNGVTGYQWKPFDSLSDDDRDLSYTLIQLGAGYQLSNRLYGQLTIERYDVDLEDGNTAFQAYQLHELSSGEHTKNKIMLFARYDIGGAEFGGHYEYNFGEFKPDFGDGFVVQFADDATSRSNNVPVGSPGFRNRFTGWNSLVEREFEQQRLKVYMKVRF